MGETYTRQSSSTIVDGATIEAEATDEGYGSKKYMEDDDDVKKEEVELEEELEEDLDEEINLDEHGNTEMEEWNDE